MNPSDSPPSIEAYTPGHVPQKLALLVASLLILALGMSQLWAPLRLLAFGRHAEAEAVSVVRTRAGQPDFVMTSDSEIMANQAPHDRSFIYWNDFVIHSSDGRKVSIRANIGSRINPLFPLRNSDGLPTTETICYDPARPAYVIFPHLISTWLVPCVLTLGGLAGVLLGSFLLYWARRPIELPHIPSSAEQTAKAPESH